MFFGYTGNLLILNLGGQSWPDASAALKASREDAASRFMGLPCFVRTGSFESIKGTFSQLVESAIITSQFTSGRVGDPGTGITTGYRQFIDFQNNAGEYCAINGGSPVGGSIEVLDGIHWNFPQCRKTHIVKLLPLVDAPESSSILTSVEPGKVATNLRARVFNENGQLALNTNVKLEVRVIANSGGHRHDDPTRRKGKLSNGVTLGVVITGNTGSDGMGFVFAAPAPAGDHKIIASCLDRTCKQEGPDTVWVGMKGLIPLPASPIYELVGETLSHPVNSHYLTPVASAQARILAIFYHSKFPNDPVLRFNDASLERGGLFDSDAHKGKPWQPPHETHRLGREIDIRWNPRKHPTTSIPDRNRQIFELYVFRVGGRPVPAYVGTDNQHYHVELGE